MNIRVTDVREMYAPMKLPDEAKLLVIPEWTSKEWLKSVDIRTSQYGYNKLTVKS